MQVTEAVLYFHGHCLHIRKTRISEIRMKSCWQTPLRGTKERGYDVYFQTGTDEHGQKIELKAQDAGVTPQGVCGQRGGRDQKYLGSDEHIL